MSMHCNGRKGQNRMIFEYIKKIIKMSSFNYIYWTYSIWRLKIYSLDALCNGNNDIDKNSVDLIWLDITDVNQLFSF